MDPTRLLTLPQLASIAGVEYRTIHTWVQRGLIEPSVQSSGGTGTPNLFSPPDAVVAVVVADLRRAGASLDVLERAAAVLGQQAETGPQPGILVVNGKAEIVETLEEANSRLDDEGSAFLHRLSHAGARVQEALAQQA